MTAVDRSRVEAAQIAELASEFARTVILGVSLSDLTRLSQVDAVRRIASIQRNIVELRASVASLSERIEGLNALRSKYEPSSPAPGESDPGVQVQVSGGRFLALQRQMIGLESERVDTTEQLRKAEYDLRKYEATARVATKWDEIVKSKDTPESMLRQMAAILQEERNGLADDEENTSVVAAIADLEVPLASARARFEGTLITPSTVVVLREGPAVYWLILAGIAFGFAVWLFLARAVTFSTQES